MTSELIALEEQGWRALSGSAEDAASFYSRVLDDYPVMIPPCGIVLDNRTAIIESMSGQPWSAYQLDDLRVFHPAPDTAIVAYSATANAAAVLPTRP